MVVILSPSFEAVCSGVLKNLRNLEMNLQINAIKKLLKDHSFKLNRKIVSHFRRKGSEIAKQRAFNFFGTRTVSFISIKR